MKHADQPVVVWDGQRRASTKAVCSFTSSARIDGTAHQVWASTIRGMPKERGSTMQAPLQPTTPDAQDYCQAMRLATPLQPGGACLRPARWVIVGHAIDGEALTTFYACDDAQHRSQCVQQAWMMTGVQSVSTDLIVPVR